VCSVCKLDGTVLCYAVLGAVWKGQYNTMSYSIFCFSVQYGVVQLSVLQGSNLDGP
jgi:hypothetical protein